MAILIVRWLARTAGTGLFLFAFPFYIGYGWPIPFLDPDATAHDNAWISAFPFILAGLVLGWFRERIAGWMIIIPILAGQGVTVVTQGSWVPHMMIPFVVGILYLVAFHFTQSSRRH